MRVVCPVSRAYHLFHLIPDTLLTFQAQRSFLQPVARFRPQNSISTKQSNNAMPHPRTPHYHTPNPTLIGKGKTGIIILLSTSPSRGLKLPRPHKSLSFIFERSIYERLGCHPNILAYLDILSCPSPLHANGLVFEYHGLGSLRNFIVGIAGSGLGVVLWEFWRGKQCTISNLSSLFLRSRKENYKERRGSCQMRS